MGESGMQQHLSQRIVAGAAMQRRLGILQASGMELEHLVRQIVDSNPVLEMEMPADVLSLEGDTHEYESGEDGWSDSDDEYFSDDDREGRRDYYYDSIVASESLSSRLREQILQSSLPDDVSYAANMLVDSLDDRGFFEEPPGDILKRIGVEPRTGDEALRVLKDLDPPGVGAVDVKDSLLLQLARSDEQESLAYQLIDRCWDDLSRRRYEHAAAILGVDTADVHEAMERIRRLNPDPGADFRVEVNPYISADIIVEKNELGEWEARLTGAGVPVLTMNNDYKEILAESADDASLRDYLKKAFNEARELMSDLAERQQTLLKLAQVLVDLQKDYFEKGSKGMKSLGMETAARKMGISVSTVSRAVSGKYLRSPWGYKDLRSFFSSGVERETEQGGMNEKASLAQEAVQSLIRELIAGESLENPLSDSSIAELLSSKHGLKIARRTVAKYRDLMKILPASLRKKA